MSFQRHFSLLLALHIAVLSYSCFFSLLHNGMAFEIVKVYQHVLFLLTWQCSFQEMERSADVLAAGLLEVADPSLSSRFFLRQVRLNLKQ